MKSCLVQRGFVIPSAIVNKSLLCNPLGFRSSVLVPAWIRNTHARLSVCIPEAVHYIREESLQDSVVSCTRTIINSRRQLGTYSQPTDPSPSGPRNHFEIWRTVKLHLALIRFRKSRKLRKFPRSAAEEFQPMDQQLTNQWSEMFKLSSLCLSLGFWLNFINNDKWLQNTRDAKRYTHLNYYAAYTYFLWEHKIGANICSINMIL